MKELPGQLLTEEDSIDTLIKGTTEKALARLLLSKGLQVCIQPDLCNRKKADFFVLNTKNPNATGTLLEVTDSDARTAKRNKFAGKKGKGQTNALIQQAEKKGFRWAVLPRENLYHMSRYSGTKFSRNTGKNMDYHDEDEKNYPYLYDNLQLHLGLSINEVEGMTYKPKGTVVQKRLVLELLKMWVYKREKVTKGQGLPVNGIAAVFRCHPDTVVNNINGYPGSSNTGIGCFEIKEAFADDDLVKIISARSGIPTQYCSNCYFHERNLCNPEQILPPVIG